MKTIPMAQTEPQRCLVPAGSGLSVGSPGGEGRCTPRLNPARENRQDPAASLSPAEAPALLNAHRLPGTPAPMKPSPGVERLNITWGSCPKLICLNTFNCVFHESAGRNAMCLHSHTFLWHKKLHFSVTQPCLPC